jgi:hypothetical protein
LSSKFTGDNTDYSMNFVPVMDKTELLKGYNRIIREIYSSKSYYERVLSFLKQYNPSSRDRITFNKIMALIKSIFYIGILRKNRRYYWKLLFWTILNKPKIFPLAVTYSIYGYHFRRVFRNIT